MLSQQDIIAKGDKYVMRTYGRTPITLVRGKGVWVWDAEGKKYLDFVAGLAVNNLGHCHPRVVEAIARQAGTLIHCSNLYYIEPQVRLAEQLVNNSALDRVFFCNSGAEAVEAAIKLARKHAKKVSQDKSQIITALQSFHGRTLAAITATGQPKYQKGYEPLPAGFKHVPFNDFTAMEEALTDDVCAVLLEPVQGEGGVNVAEREYLQGVRHLCDERGALLILDEVQTGMGRTGRLFAYEHYGIEPDILALAKALAGGFPMGAMLAREEIAQAFSPGDHASTFGGNPLACVAAIASLGVLLGEDYVKNAEVVGSYFRKRLADLIGRYHFVKEVRGLGLMLALELYIPGAGIVDRCRNKGLLVNCVKENVLRFVPPLIVSTEDVDAAMKILIEALDEEREALDSDGA